MSMEKKIRVDNAFRAMKAVGITQDKVKRVLKALLVLNSKNWEAIEADNYKALVDAIVQRDVYETLYRLEKEPREPQEAELKDGHTSSLNISAAHNLNVPHINVNNAKYGFHEDLKNLAEARRFADEANLGSMLASHPNTSKKRKVSDSLQLELPSKKFRDDQTSSKLSSVNSSDHTSAEVKPLELVISDVPREASGAVGGVSVPPGSSSQGLMDSFMMSLRKESSGVDMPGIAAAGSLWQVGHALRQFASGAYALICAQEGMKSSHDTVSKLQAEATALRLEVAEANRAKATASENLQGVVQYLLKSLEGMKAEREVMQDTLEKTRSQLQTTEQELVACKQELDAAEDMQWEANKQVALAAVVDTIRESHPEWDLSFLYQET